MTRKLVSLFLCLTLLGICGAAAAEGGIALTDMMGREISLNGPADRVVVMMPADAEILWALGAADTVKGVGTYCSAPEEQAVMPGIETLPVVDSGYVTNVEEILKLAPQAVVMTRMGHSEDLVETLNRSGVQVVVTDAQNLEGVYQDIRLLGALVGKNEEAEALITEMQSRLDAVTAAAGETGKTLYVEESPLQWGLWTAGKGTYMDDLARICGLTNIFAELEGHQAVSEEQVLQRNPDVIVTMTMYYGEGELPDEEICHRKGWETVSAVQENRVLYDPTNAVALPGPRLADVAEMLLKLVQGTEAEQPAA